MLRCCQGIKADYFWVGKTLNVGGVDVALEGGDTAYFAAGRVGMATGYRTPDGVEVHFGRIQERVATSGAADGPAFALPKADTVGLADEIKKYAKQLDIPLAHLMLDRTGNGAGVHDVLKSSDSGVMGVNYSENASETKVLAEDTDTAILTYDRALSELWFALRKWLEVKAIMVGPYVDTDELFRELTGRQVHSSDRTKKQRVESKKDYKDRNGGASPTVPTRSPSFCTELGRSQASSPAWSPLTTAPRHARKSLANRKSGYRSS